jgi:hypothetical protein
MHGERGYCTEFIVRGRALPLTVCARVSPRWASLLVVGGDDLLRVHFAPRIRRRDRVRALARRGVARQSR